MGKVEAPQVGWWTRSVSDGDGHYGQRQDGVVRAMCGEVFVPEVNPWTQEAERQVSPADPAHACPDCRRLKSRRQAKSPDATGE